MDKPGELERFQDAMYLASNAFFDVEQLFRALRAEIEVSGGAIDERRVVAFVQMGIDLTHMQGEVIGQAADAFHGACHA